MSDVLITFRALEVALREIRLDQILRASPGTAAEFPTPESQAVLNNHPEAAFLRSMANVIVAKKLEGAFALIFQAVKTAVQEFTAGNQGDRS